MKLSFIFILLLFCSLHSYGTTPKIKVYCNPVLAKSTPDPTVIQAPDGMFYLYATEDIHNIPIYKSPDLVNWTFVGTAFTDATRPTSNPKPVCGRRISITSMGNTCYTMRCPAGEENILAVSDAPLPTRRQDHLRTRENSSGVMKSEFKTLSIPFISKKTEKNTCFGEVSGVFIISN